MLKMKILSIWRFSWQNQKIKKFEAVQIRIKLEFFKCEVVFFSKLEIQRIDLKKKWILS